MDKIAILLLVHKKTLQAKKLINKYYYLISVLYYYEKDMN